MRISSQFYFINLDCLTSAEPRSVSLSSDSHYAKQLPESGHGILSGWTWPDQNGCEGNHD